MRFSWIFDEKILTINRKYSKIDTSQMVCDFVFDGPFALFGLQSKRGVGRSLTISKDLL